MSENELLLVRYQDHVLFKNMDPSRLTPSIRIAVGWPLLENEEYLVLVSDRSQKTLPNEHIPIESGLIIIKSTILERRSLEQS